MPEAAAHSVDGPPVPFSDLPLSKELPDAKLNAWGLYGDDDEKGFLNRQTDEVVKNGAHSEIRTGKRISLNAPLDFQGSVVLFARQSFHKDIYQKKPRLVNDDVWTFNTQSSSQWDGLRHLAYQKAERFYNNTTMDDIHSPSKKHKNFLGIQNFEEQGIVGRGVLVDFEKWRSTEGAGKGVDGASEYEPLKTSGLKLEWLKACLEWQGTEVRWGDILMVRSGFKKAFSALSETEVKQIADKLPHPLGGMEQSEEGLRWIWEHFSAVAGDQPAFESWPSSFDWSFHEVLLSGWGCPIGELFDLEKLSEHCAKEKRYSFFVTSEVVNVPGGVASPPNILAIF